VLVVIFLLLWITYRSALEAAHVLLAVPFALSGGLFLVWMLGYNFSVAVWVGFIALFGTAVQTAVVMVIYLEESLARKQLSVGGALTRTDIYDAVMEGALLRLRPKVMTVSTVVAGLLPIMWSTRVGAEVMKPLAAPVLGGMVSSLLHVLVVTPVIFSLIRERELRAAPAPALAPAVGPGPTDDIDQSASAGRRRIGWAIAAVVVVIATGGVWWYTQRDRAHPPDAAAGVVIETARAGDLVVSLVSADGALRQGRSSFFVEFRSASTNQLVDAGTLRVGATMTMPGMSMQASTDVSGASPPGRYQVSSQFSMAGVWKLNFEWSGGTGAPAGSLTINGDVQ
jgi:Cu(I)/Ag(I) efflux system membrane protein CusA/SilA